MASTVKKIGGLLKIIQNDPWLEPYSDCHQWSGTNYALYREAHLDWKAKACLNLRMVIYTLACI